MQHVAHRRSDEIAQLNGRVASLEFELKAKTNECEIADGKIERLQNALLAERARVDRLAKGADKLIHENYLLKRKVEQLTEAAEDIVSAWACGEPIDESARELRTIIGWEAVSSDRWMAVRMGRG